MSSKLLLDFFSVQKNNKKQPPDWKNWPLRLVVEYNIYSACTNYKCGLSNNSSPHLNLYSRMLNIYNINNSNKTNKIIEIHWLKTFSSLDI